MQKGRKKTSGAATRHPDLSSHWYSIKIKTPRYGPLKHKLGRSTHFPQRRCTVKKICAEIQEAKKSRKEKKDEVHEDIDM